MEGRQRLIRKRWTKMNSSQGRDSSLEEQSRKIQSLMAEKVRSTRGAKGNLKEGSLWKPERSRVKGRGSFPERGLGDLVEKRGARADCRGGGGRGPRRGRLIVRGDLGGKRGSKGGNGNARIKRELPTIYRRENKILKKFSKASPTTKGHSTKRRWGRIHKKLIRGGGRVACRFLGKENN